MTLPVLAAILSALCHPFFPTFAKKAAHPLTLNFLGMSVATLTFSFCYFNPEFWGKVLTHWKLIAPSGILHTAYVIVMLSLICKHEFQVMYPLTRLAPILIMIGEIIFLGTEFAMIQIIGICSVISGALIFGFDRKIEHIRKQILLSIAAITLMVTAFYLLDKKLVQYFSASEMWALALFQLPLFAPIILSQKKALLLDLKNWKNLMGYSVAMIGTWYFAVIALKGLDAAVVSSVRNLSIIFGILVGAHLFNEGHKIWRYVAAILIITGAWMTVK